MPPIPQKTTTETMSQRLQAFARVPQLLLDDVLNKIKYLPQTNFELGRQMMRENRLTDAVFRFRMVLWLAPDYQPAWFLLGVCYSMKGDDAKAIAALKKSLSMKLDHEESLFALANIDPSLLPKGRAPRVTPVELVNDYFNTLAPDYDREQEELGYRGHVLAWGSLRQHLTTYRTNYSVLDIGCGTGLCGVQGEDIIRLLVGVDISRQMLNLATVRVKADGRLLYGETYHEDLRDYLRNLTEARFEIIIAAHVFSYIGDLAPVFDGAVRALLPGGIMVFQVEPYRGASYGVLPGKGRFGHDETYIRSELQRVGLELVEVRDAPVYPTVAHQQYVVRRPGQPEQSPLA